MIQSFRKGSLLLTVLPYPLNRLKNGILVGNIPLKRERVLTAYAGLTTLCANIFPISNSCVLLCSVRACTSDGIRPIPLLSAPYKKRTGSFCCNSRGVYAGQLPYTSCQNRPTVHRGPMPATGAVFALPLLYIQSSV